MKCVSSEHNFFSGASLLCELGIEQIFTGQQWWTAVDAKLHLSSLDVMQDGAPAG